MMDKDHKKWIDILSFGAPIQRQQDDTPEGLATQQDEDPTAALLLPAVQSVRLSSAGGDDFDFQNFKAMGTDDDTEYVLEKVMVTSYQTGGSAERPEPEPTLTDMPHDAPMPVDGFDFF